MNKKPRNRRSQVLFCIVFAITASVLALIQSAFSFPIPPLPDPTADDVPSVMVQNAETFVEPPSITAPLRKNTRVWSYDECFPDSQATQLPAALQNGISPVETRSDIMELVRKHQLVDISQSPFYCVDELQHSMPYLVPKAQQLLNTIAINFLDSLHRKGLPLHKPVVSSVLRTTDDVSRLQNGNKNATTNSCHCYGTTIDIAYHRFIPLDKPLQVTRYDDDLKFVLAEVLNDLRQEGRCYIKYEYKQACFHLTVR